ncbi:peptidylprolyl isomerase [Ranunculus cassubicifolius]
MCRSKPSLSSQRLQCLLQPTKPPLEVPWLLMRLHTYHSVCYIGKLKKNGKIFDSCTNRKVPFQFRLGVGQVIKGWDVGVSGMRVGDKRRLTIPPSMGYAVGSRFSGLSEIF